MRILIQKRGKGKSVSYVGFLYESDYYIPFAVEIDKKVVIPNGPKILNDGSCRLRLQSRRRR